VCPDHNQDNRQLSEACVHANQKNETIESEIPPDSAVRASAINMDRVEEEAVTQPQDSDISRAVPQEELQSSSVDEQNSSGDAGAIVYQEYTQPATVEGRNLPPDHHQSSSAAEQNGTRPPCLPSNKTLVESDDSDDGFRAEQARMQHAASQNRASRCTPQPATRVAARDAKDNTDGNVAAAYKQAEEARTASAAKKAYQAGKQAQSVDTAKHKSEEQRSTGVDTAHRQSTKQARAANKHDQTHTPAATQPAARHFFGGRGP
jgi:hypothetical protein